MKKSVGSGHYGVKNHSHNYSKERNSLVSFKDALQLMLAFSTFTTELIKISKKNNRHCSKLDGYFIIYK